MSNKLEQLAHKKWNCICGRTHSTDIKRIITGDDVLSSLPELLSKQLTSDGRKLDPGHDRLLLAADRNTAELDLARISKICHGLGYKTDTCILGSEGDLVPDEKAVFTLLQAASSDTGLIIVHGSGTLNDLVRYVSFKLRLPYYIVATAPSMDGYASTVSPLIHNGMKITYEAQGADAVMAESKLLAEAPAVMLAAGLGDILGKYSAIADWKLSSLIEDEYYCPEIADIVLATVRSTLAASGAIAARDPQAVTLVMDGLIMTGIAMSFVGNSRPASGSEHHISHFWEMRFLQDLRPAVLHGSKVGLASILTCALYRELVKSKPDFSAARRRLESLSESDKLLWEKNIRRAYGSSSDEVILLEKSALKNDPHRALIRLEKIERNWQIIVAMIEELIPDPMNIQNALEVNGGAVRPAELGISKELVFEAAAFARELRNRYTVLQLYWDLGLESQAEAVARRVYEL
ncbi:MAG: sn-glycerol-1-phosphate dehydrogenase [Clostridiaceae bacterium]|nr:sn-glycerol-1-phosphate dehydrogenase [Clostridiaceae bacterium]